jgi:hypothetical protein
VLGREMIWSLLTPAPCCLLIFIFHRPPLPPSFLQRCPLPPPPFDKEISE